MGHHTGALASAAERAGVVVACDAAVGTSVGAAVAFDE